MNLNQTNRVLADQLCAATTDTLPAGPIMQEMNRLTDTRVKLQEVIQELEAKLQPVLYTPSGGQGFGEANKSEPEPRPELELRLQTEADILVVMMGWVSNLAERVRL